MKNVKQLLALLLILSTSYVSAQLEYGKRLELEQKDGYSSERILEFGENGFIVSSRSTKNTGKEGEWRYQKYNTDMILVETKSVKLNNKLRFNETDTDKERTHTFLTDKKGNFTIISVEASDLSITIRKELYP